MSVGNDSLISRKLKQWALEHPGEWDVVLGLTMADIDTNLDIQKMLSQDGFPELSEMMAIRVYRLLAKNDDSGS